MTKHLDLFASLAAPFDPQELKVRTLSGRQLNYITARTVMNRLDDVLGPENWWDEYQPSENSVLCRLTIRMPDGSTLTKADAGGYAGMSDSGDDDKSGYSDAFKRAAVKFGIARYLYRDGVPAFAQDRTPAAAPEPTPQPPAPTAVADPAPATAVPPATAARANGGSQPRTGKALFAWTKDQEQRYEVALVKYLNQWARLQEFPGRMIDWNSDQVDLAYQEACRKLQAIDSHGREVQEEALAN